MSTTANGEHEEPEHSVDKPEDGRFWHALSREGLEMFIAKSDVFGKKTVETTGSSLAVQRCIRCQPFRNGVSPWLRNGGALLAIPKDELLETDWAVAGSAGDIHVVATAALAHGELVD